MAQVKRNRKQIASTVDEELWEAFRTLSQNMRIPASRMLDEALEDLLLKYEVISEKVKTP
ncbi:MAG TPA: ribbon-helix-helix domain-containing protein [Candidatus Acutalibacter pullicola]|uniref:Ribbon-helix-helix domain-containing protein n=1 Tax=Candidatus Acutalibacter pullicola TaxID=2838417 RepID=A0A9D2MU76_9FIRM|nr:ribbon-helix-helix domain-containing protein [Candidatus Acutalibacter pullicola]